MIPPSLVLEKARGTIQRGLVHERSASLSCVRGAVFRHRETGIVRPFRCGTCHDCHADYAKAFRRGAARACRQLGLTSMITFTLPGPGLVAPRRPTWDGHPWDKHLARAKRFGTFHGAGTSASEAHRGRKAITAALNRFKARLRWRGLLGDDLWAEEAHADGTAHLHDAVNDSAICAAFGNDYSKVRAYLQEIAFDAGLGYIDWSTSHRGNPNALAAELAKYLGKSFAGKGRAPWRSLQGCTVEGGFQLARFHRWGGSRAASAIVRSAVRPRRPAEGEWELAMHLNRPDVGRSVSCSLCGHVQVLAPADPPPRTCPWDEGGCGRTLEGEPDPDYAGGVRDRTEFVDAGRFVPWSPGRAVAIEPACTRHFPDPELPFACHHRGADWFGCGCSPPWLYERPVDRPDDLLGRLARSEPVPGVSPYDPVNPLEPAVHEIVGMRESWTRAGLRTFPRDVRPHGVRLRSSTRFELFLDPVKTDSAASVVDGTIESWGTVDSSVAVPPPSPPFELSGPPAIRFNCSCALCLAAARGCRRCPRCQDAKAVRP